MNEKEYSNMFRFSLTQGNIIDGKFNEEVLLCESMFDADKFNPFTRYSIDIRDILPKAITRLQKTLSKKTYDMVVEVGRIDINDTESGHHSYDLHGYYDKMINLYPEYLRNGIQYNPESVVEKIEHRTIRGVPCKIGLYINDNPIVEREFYVDGYNPLVLHSLDIMYVVTDIAETIEEKIKKSDIRNMWDDYDLINQRGLSINQIRELHPSKRAEMLRRLKRN